MENVLIGQPDNDHTSSTTPLLPQRRSPGFLPILVNDAERLCGKLNKRLGLTREQWTAFAAQSMRAEMPELGDPTEH